jgi:hypothetical protein
LTPAQLLGLAQQFQDFEATSRSRRHRQGMCLFAEAANQVIPGLIPGLAGFN